MIPTDFQELNLPNREVIDGKIQWCVCVKTDGFFYLANNESFTVINLLQNTVGLLNFDSLVEAHADACVYYSNHGVLYPYFPEYNQAVKEEKMAKNGSQQMTFKS